MAEKNGVQESGGTTTDSAEFKDKAKHWAIIGAVGIIGALIIAAVVPRWWSSLIGNIVNESLIGGTLIGIAIGFVCTFVPYWLFSTGWRKRDSGSNFFLILGLIIAIPNLITLWIVLGFNHAAELSNARLELDAPGFKLGTLLGVIAAIALAIFFWNLRRQRDSAKAEAARERERAEAKAAAEDTTRVVEHKSSTSTTSAASDAANKAADAATNTDPPTHP